MCVRVCVLTQVGRQQQQQQQQQEQQQDGATLHIQERGLEVIRRLGSVIQRDSFETSVLTAIFVIVGWKMLIKN